MWFVWGFVCGFVWVEWELNARALVCVLVFLKLLRFLNRKESAPGRDKTRNCAFGQIGRPLGRFSHARRSRCMIRSISLAGAQSTVINKILPGPLSRFARTPRQESRMRVVREIDRGECSASSRLSCLSSACCRLLSQVATPEFRSTGPLRSGCVLRRSRGQSRDVHKGWRRW